MKRILAVILTLALLFAGCRKGTDRKQENNNKLEESVGELTEVIPSKGRTVKNIVIGGRPAILAFDAQSAAILWQDGVCSYLLTGPFTADEAMRTARSMPRSMTRSMTEG